MFRLRFSRGQHRQFSLRLLQPRPIAQSRHDIPIRIFQVLRVGPHGNPEVHQGIYVVVRLLRRSRRWKKAYPGRHHADHRRRHFPPADANGLAYDLWIPVERAFPKVVPQQDHLHRSCPNVRLLKAATEHRLQTHDREIVFGHLHPLDRLAAFVANQKIERPTVGSDSFKRLRLFLPFHPLLGGPAARAFLLLAVSSRRRNQHQLLRLLVGWRLQQHAMNQAEHGRGRPDSKSQRQHRNQAKTGLFQQHPNRKSHVSPHLSPFADSVNHLLRKPNRRTFLTLSWFPSSYRL